MPPPDKGPLKMVSHNTLLTIDEGGETAFIKAREMGISLVRYGFQYHQMDTDKADRWLWDSTDSNRWNDLMDPALRWTKEHGMRTLVNLIAYKPPSYCLEEMRGKWEEHWAAFSGSRRRPRALSQRDCALWASWADGNGVDEYFQDQSPRAYAEALLGRLAEGQAAGDYDIAGFCILNEPNTKWPGEANWRSLDIPGDAGWRSYSTADLCSDLCDWVKSHIRAEHQDTLGHTVNVVNLYAYRGHWRDPSWVKVAANPNVDVLGIDIYWDHLWGVFARGRPEAMRSIAEEHGKPWWLVEAAGADNPAWLTRNPSCRAIKARSDLCSTNGAAVLGYYRLWGNYGGRSSYAGAYSIFTDPGPEPTPRRDRRGNAYWDTIRDL